MQTVRLVVAAGAAGVIALAVPAAPAAAQLADTARIDAVFAEYARAGSPGCALGIVRDGDLVLQRGYGYANLDYDLPNAPDMVYYVGSVSKQFTAAAIALLAQDGRIGLDDDVRRYIPELPDYGRTMTIRHLVHHTSGLRDIYSLMSLAGRRLEDVFTDDEALGLITRQRGLTALPGDEYLYSNSGYWLLGLIVRRVSGQSLREFADERIFRPLGMTHTHFHDDAYHVLRNRAVSYGRNAAGELRITYLQNFDKTGAGGLYTTIGDLARWDANFYEPRVGGPDLLRTLHTRGVLTSGDTLRYAFGLEIGRRRGLDIVRHSGALMGFRSDFVRYPTERLSIITLCNLGSIEPAELNDRVADVVLGPAVAATPVPAPAAPPGRPVAAADRDRPARPVLAQAGLEALAGPYHSAELDVVYPLEADGGGLRLPTPSGSPLIFRPVATDRFEAGGMTLRFQRDAAGRPTGFTLDAGRIRDIAFTRQHRP